MEMDKTSDLNKSKGDEFIRILLDESTDPIFSFERDGTYRYINWAFARPFGKKPEDIIGKKIWDIFPKEEADRRFALVKNVFETGKVGIIEVRVPQTAPKEDLYFLTSAKPVFDNHGQVEMVICISKDITERKRMEETLKASEAKFRLLTNHAPIAISWANPQGVIEYINQTFTDNFGYVLEDIPTLKDWFAKSYPEMIVNEENNQNLLRTGTVDDQAESGAFSQKMPITCKDGSVRIVHFARTFINGYTYAMFMDITEQIHAEEKIRCMNEKLEERVRARTADLEQAVHELESFSYSVSHDLRTPLRAIDGFSSILLEDYASNLPSKGQQITQAIRKNTQRMSRLIDDMLAFSRLSRSEMNPKRVEMQTLAEQAYNHLAQSGQQDRIQFSLEKLPPVIGDSDLLFMVWCNLISNAIKFSSPKDHPVIEIGSQKEENKNIYFIRDNGVGFDMQYAGKLFGFFQRLHAVNEFEGSGVGLAMVERIVQRHKGRVWADSQINKGTTIYFSLPVEVNPKA